MQTADCFPYILRESHRSVFPALLYKYPVLHNISGVPGDRSGLPPAFSCNIVPGTGKYMDLFLFCPENIRMPRKKCMPGSQVLFPSVPHTVPASQLPASDRHVRTWRVEESLPPAHTYPAGIRASVPIKVPSVPQIQADYRSGKSESLHCRVPVQIHTAPDTPVLPVPQNHNPESDSWSVSSDFPFLCLHSHNG